MRLRFLWINYYEEASKAVLECYQQNQLSVPQLNDCLLPAVGCVTLVSLWIIPELLKRELVTVGDPLKMQQLYISMVQEHFLSAVLPVKIIQSWNSWQTTDASHLLDKAMLRQETPREPRLTCFPEFESTVLDTPQQNNLVMIVLSELSSIVNRKRGDLSMWEDQFRKESGNLLSFEEMFFLPEKEKMVLQDCFDGRNEIGYSVNSLAFGLPTVSVGCAHSSFTLRNRLRLKPPVLEVATVDEALCCSRMPSLWQDLKRMTTELFLHVDHVQLSSLMGLLETDLTELASNLFSFKFPMQLESINDLFLHLGGEAHQLLWKFLCHEDVCENLSMSLAAGCQKHLPMFELPVPFWEIKKSVASWGLKQLLKVVDISWQRVHAPETPDSAHLEQFEALVVMPELVLRDYVFSSLPVPTVKGKERGCIATDVMLEALCLCKYSVPLALNFLYLDWHFSHKKDCGKHSCFVLESKIHEVERYELVKYAIPQFESVDIDSAFNKKDINLEKKCSLERESPAFSPKQSCSLDSRESVCPLLPAHQAESPDKGHRTGDGTPPDPVSKNLGSSIVEASVPKPKLGNMFAFNDLTFFLQARHGTVNALSTFGNTVQKEIPEVDHVSVDEKMGEFHVHDILLSEPILRLRGFLELDYCRILEADANLAFQLQTYRVLNKLCTDIDAKTALIMLIKERACKQHSPHEQQLLRGLIALYILQQTAENLFMYGVQVGLLYMESWYLNLRFLQDLVCFSYVELEEAYKQVEKGLLLDHPKLICLGNIIERHESKVLNPKFLVIAERRALFTLYKEIISHNLKPYQFDREENLLHDDGSSNKDPDLFKQAVTDALLKCDCLMVPPEYITTSFPIKQFSCIVQYGDFSVHDGGDVKFDSDKWASEVHTFQITTKKHDCMAEGDIHIPYSGATQQDARRPCTGAMLQEVFSQDLASGSAQQSMRKDNSKLQNELPMEASASSQNKKPETIEGLQAKDVDAVEHDNTSASIFRVTGLIGKQPSVYKQCDMNIVVNINQLYKHLLSGQRNSYQKILAFEKDGLHVIERDLFLPIDLILSPSVCLIRYTQEKLISSEPTSSQTVQLSCIEDITNGIMKALSFSFKTCVMVFEGSFNFVAEALQTFGYLHAAAIGLDIQLQCFISGSLSMTDMIIAECIGEVRRSKKATSFPAMLEAKTFAESFLTEFTSINPLTAHAILSCGVGLRQFMSLKVEEQLSLTESFDLNERSLLLFKQQLRSRRSGRICRGSKWVCSDDNLSVDQSKMRNFVSTSSKVSKLDEDLTLCKSRQSHDADENEWCSERTVRKAAVHAPDDFLLPECDLWPVNKTDNQDLKHAQFRSCLADMSPSIGALQSVDLPVQKVRTCCVASNYDTKLKRTMDLILKRNAHIVEKEGYQNASGTKSCSKPPANKDVRSSLYAFDQSSSQKKRYFSVASGLSPELDPANIIEHDTPQDDDVGSSVYAHDQSSSQKRWHCFPVASKLSPELDPVKIFENDTSQECDVSFLSQQGQSKAMEANVGDLFEYQLHKDSRQSHKECPVEFANETRAHLKRKLNFESPATVKHFKRRPLEGQKNSKPNFFDKYRYEGKAKQLQPESAGAYSQGFSCRNLYNSPHQDAYCEKHLSCVQRSSCSVQRNTCINSQRCSRGGEHQPKNCPSWTPVDKRSKKVLSFARKGNDRQSRLVWESSKDATKQPKTLPQFEDSFY